MEKVETFGNEVVQIYRRWHGNSEYIVINEIICAIFKINTRVTNKF